MKKVILLFLVSIIVACNINAAVITVAGGVATNTDNITYTVEVGSTYYDIVTYVESNFQLNYEHTTGSYSPPTIQQYYDEPNNILQINWTGGKHSIDILNVNGSIFDLNFFLLTSIATDSKGTAGGREHLYVQGYRYGQAVTAPYLLPTNSNGIITTDNILLSNEFDNIDLFRIFGEGAFNFGIDAFYINEAAPNVEGVVIGQPAIPEPGVTTLLPLGLAALLLIRRRN